MPKISSQESVETFNIVPQERISERMCEQTGVVEVLQISSQESVEAVKNCNSGTNLTGCVNRIGVCPISARRVSSESNVPQEKIS